MVGAVNKVIERHLLHSDVSKLSCRDRNRSDSNRYPLSESCRLGAQLRTGWNHRIDPDWIYCCIQIRCYREPG